MTVKTLALAGLAAVSLILPSAQVMAQETATSAAADASAPAERAPEQNWLKICDPLEDGKKACILRQVVTANGQTHLSASRHSTPGWFILASGGPEGGW